MKIRRYLPGKHLMPFVKTYLVLDSVEGSVNRVIPDTSLVMVFRYKGQVKLQTDHNEQNLPFAVLSGLRRSVRLISYAPGSGNILVQFKESRASVFFKEPLIEFMDDSVPIDCLATYKDSSIIESQLSNAGSDKERIDLIESYLWSKLSYEKPDLLVQSALQKIQSTQGAMRIKDLAASLCISLDPFEKRFRNSIGISPKAFSKIIRLRNIIHSDINNKSLVETSLSAGYFDQSHFNRDFKFFTGQSPTDFLNTRRFW